MVSTYTWSGWVFNSSFHPSATRGPGIARGRPDSGVSGYGKPSAIHIELYGAASHSRLPKGVVLALELELVVVVVVLLRQAPAECAPPQILQAWRNLQYSMVHHLPLNLRQTDVSVIGVVLLLAAELGPFRLPW